MRHLKRIPKFASEEAERKFWAKHEVSDYFDSSNAAKMSFPNLKPTSRIISIRLPESLLAHIRVIANQADVPYQSMMKMLLAEKVSELRRRPRKRRVPAA
jgi:predicted DNA binding CopG/RHH family protein